MRRDHSPDGIHPAVCAEAPSTLRPDEEHLHGDGEPRSTGLPERSPPSGRATELRMLATYRYPRSRSLEREVDGYPNLFSITAGLRHIGLERGINPIASVKSPSGERRPAILIRSSPSKAGTESTPWHDVFDLDSGHVRYFGDHKATSPVPIGRTDGNRLLQQALGAHFGHTVDQRMKAAPLILFRTTRVGSAVKGYVQFAGLAVIERVEQIVQWDHRTGLSYPNFVYDLAVLDLGSETETLDWAWINDRRNSELSDEESLRYAPSAWRTWTELGPQSLTRVRRRVSRHRILGPKEQRPEPRSAEARVLEIAYESFSGRKHAFEAIASAISGRILHSNGGTYVRGWLTQPSGDRGVDFVGRLDVGSGEASTRIVVLGQAKCILPTSSISAEELARVVARLQRGWIGVYVTTGVFSRFAQQEIVEDGYPVILVHGRRLATELLAMAYETHAGDVASLINDLCKGDFATVTHRRPEEILLA